MKILFAAAESSPFVKAGGLGDVMGSLPKALIKSCEDVRVVLPLYSSIDREKYNINFLKYFFINLGDKHLYVGVFETTIDKVKYYFIDNEHYFKREKIYGEYDDAERFAFFSKAVIDLLPEIDFFPDIIHANDWHTALVPIYLVLYKRNRTYRYENIKSVFSIHNIEFQGQYGEDLLNRIFGLDNSYHSVLYYGDCLNLLKGAIQASDAITTVSKTYAQEILNPYFSYGLSDILKKEEWKLSGIVNGIDVDLFSPSKDKLIYQNYNRVTKKRKNNNKMQLQEYLNLEVNENIPMIAMITRLTHQKGIDLLLSVFDDIASKNIQLVIIGTGDAKYEHALRERAARYKNCSINIYFSTDLAQKLYASADMFLMPSKAEPCGLSQLIAMRYGTVPIVHTVGGLKDTVIAYNEADESGTGFTFQSFNAHDMLYAIDRALELYQDKKAWKKLVDNCMAQDFSWTKSANKYLEICKNLKGN